MHHDSQLNEEIATQFREAQLGPTGKFPAGHLTDTDEGEIVIGITSFKGKVVMNFGKPIVTLGFTAKQARQIANTLRQHANKIEPKSGPHARR